MTTSFKRYEYKYRIDQLVLFARTTNLIAKMEMSPDREIIGTAIVNVTCHDVLRDGEIMASFQELRYLTLDENHELDVTYKENPDFVKIDIALK